MHNSKFARTSQVIAFMLVCLLNPAENTFAVTHKMEDKVVRDLDSNTAGVRQLSVSWERSRSSKLALDDLLKLIATPDDKDFFLPEFNTVIYQQGKIWRNRTSKDWSDGRLYDRNDDHAFDGKLLYFSDSTREFPVIGILDLDYLATRNSDNFVFYCEFLEAAGYKVYNRFGTIHQPPESELLHLVNHGAEVTGIRLDNVETSTCLSVIVTTQEGRVAFWLDVDKQYAVRKRVSYNYLGKKLTTTVNSEFAEINSPHVWLPKRSVVSHYTWPTIPDNISSDPIVLTDIVVKDLSQKVWPPERFVINATRPGSFVMDSRPEASKMPGAARRDNKLGLIHYRLNASPEDLARAVAVNRSRWRRIFIGVGLPALLLTLFVAYRHSQKKK